MSIAQKVSGNQRWESEVHFWRSAFGPSVNKLRNAQFRTNSLYHNLRALVPVLVLVSVWLTVIHWQPGSDFHRLLSKSVSVRHLLLACGVSGLWNVWLRLSMYEMRSARKDLYAELSRLLTCSIACGMLLLIGNVGRGQYVLGLELGGMISLGLILTSLALLGSFLVGAVLSPRILRRRAAIIVGTGPRAEILRERLQGQYSPFNLYGCVDDEYLGDDDARGFYLGTIEQLPDLLKTNPIEIVLIGLPIKSKYDEIQNVIEICESVGVESHYMRDVFNTSRARLEVGSRSSHHFNVLSTLTHHPKQAFKRCIDIVAAGTLIVLTSPIMLAAAIAVMISSPGPILFTQQRYGRHRERFPMFKFRSMVVDAEKQQAQLESLNDAQGPVFKLKSDPRVTRVGSFLRRTSIDELPQLFNVLRGEMSLVGPRPLTLRDVGKFEETWLLRRFSVRPGLTCVWQVSGRSNTSFERWIKQDLSYIDEWSLSLDFKILLMTIPAVLRGSGAV